MQQFGTSAFNTVGRWRELGEVENKCKSHKFILSAISVPKIIKVGGNLTRLWQKQFCTVFWDTVYNRVSTNAIQLQYKNLFLHHRIFVDHFFTLFNSKFCSNPCHFYHYPKLFAGVQLTKWRTLIILDHQMAIPLCILQCSSAVNMC